MKIVITLLCVAALALAAVFFAPSVLGGAASTHSTCAALAVTVVVARWRIVARRRQRQKLQELRDSALW
jgi:hypothetical protein